MTVFLTVMCILISDPYTNFCMPVESQAACERALTQAVNELSPIYNTDLAVTCTPTNIVMQSDAPRTRPNARMAEK